MAKYIKAPFNFVPLNDKVIFPDWAEEVTHDIPFQDGVSGSIKVEIEAKSAIFVRNGYTKQEGESKNKNYTSFFNHNGKHYIPGSSIKGMIRNVLEIISFGKMGRISNDRYALRDLSNRNDYMDNMTGKETYCGWLNLKNENDIEITNCGIPGRVSHRDIDDQLGIDFVKKLSDNIFLNKSDYNKSTRFKYEYLKSLPLSYKFVLDIEKNDNRSNIDKRTFYKFSGSDSALDGNIVFTGQPSARTKRFDHRWTGKFYEFVFFQPKSKIEKFAISANSELWKDFMFIHKESEDWQYLKKRFKERIPVFFKLDNDNKIQSIGISYLYKLPYKKRIKDCLPKMHKNEGNDFAELVFGNNENGLKGRVQFGHAILNGNNQNRNQHLVEPLMGSPKPSYYPIYLVQNGEDGILKGNYITYMGNNARLKGWKRYPVQKNCIDNFKIDVRQKKNTSPFIPLDEGSTFSLSICFHNLKPVELGGLIQALTLLDEKDAFHTIGFAKPYGYGKVRLSLEKLQINGKERNEISYYTKQYDDYVKSYIPDWENGVMELLLMAKEQGNFDRSELSYMALPDFAKMKGTRNDLMQKQYLDYYSNLLGVKKSVSNYQASRPQQKDSIKAQVEPDHSYEALSKTDGLIKAKLIKHKIVFLDDFNSESQLVIPKAKSNIALNIGQQIWVSIKQKSKDGRITQVEYKGIV